jgi:hypothetical protein
MPNFSKGSLRRVVIVEGASSPVSYQIESRRAGDLLTQIVTQMQSALTYKAALGAEASFPG